MPGDIMKEALKKRSVYANMCIIGLVAFDCIMRRSVPAPASQRYYLVTASKVQTNPEHHLDLVSVAGACTCPHHGYAT
jgi:hypothetical protein